MGGTHQLLGGLAAVIKQCRCLSGNVYAEASMHWLYMSNILCCADVKELLSGKEHVTVLIPNSMKDFN